MIPGFILCPPRTRTRCQDPGRQFIRRRDKNAIQDRQRPRSHINARYNNRAFLRYAAVTLTGALYGVLCVAGMFYPVGPKTAHRGAQGAHRGIYYRHSPPARGDRPPATPPAADPGSRDPGKARSPARTRQARDSRYSRYSRYSR